MDQIDLSLTSIELWMIVMTNPGRSFESYRPVFNQAGVASIRLRRDEIENVLLNLDDMLATKAPKMIDRIKADLFLNNKSQLAAKLRRALMVPI